MTEKKNLSQGLSLIETLVLMVALYGATIISWAPITASQTIDCDDFSAIGIECNDVSPTTTTFPKDLQHSVSGRIMSLTVSSDGQRQRLYAGTFSGVWRSKDGGDTWDQLTRPQ